LDVCCDLLELFGGVTDGRVGPGRDHPVAAVLALAAAADNCLDDEDAGVRAAATALLGRHRGAAAAHLITGRLADPDPAVRSAALRAITPDHTDSTGHYRAALADPSPGVVHTALMLLQSTASSMSAISRPC